MDTEDRGPRERNQEDIRVRQQSLSGKSRQERSDVARSSEVENSSDKRYWDKRFVQETLYGRDKELSTRILTHKRYSVRKDDFVSWTVNLLELEGDEYLLDVGCGTGNFLTPVIAQLNSKGLAIGMDISIGVMNKAIQQLESAKGKVKFTRGDAESIPFRDESFDVVMANFMLYHVPDIPKAIGEMSRVLRKGGTFLATTGSETSYEEIRQVHKEALANFSDSQLTPISIPFGFYRFNLENGREYIERYFSQVETFPFPDALEFGDPKPFMDYYTTSRVYRDALRDPAKLDSLYDCVVDIVQGIIDERGKFRVRKLSGAFVAKKESN